MRGIRLDFSEAGPGFDLETPVRDFDATVQNALVNVGTDMGSDFVFATRGTNLRLDGAQGRMATEIWANHSANFASLRTLDFAQKNDHANNEYKLQTFNMRCRGVEQDRLVLQVRAVSEGGTVIGGEATI